MISKLRSILEMIRFSHTLFALPFALLATIMAWRVALPAGVDERVNDFRWIELAAVLLCMVTARSAAMAFNRLADRKIDAGNPRTANRHLVTGELSVMSVGTFFVAMSFGFIGATALFLPNWWPLVLSVPVLLFICGYSLTKRFTSLAHFWLGASLMLTPICAWIAIRGELLTEHPTDLLPAVMIGLAVLAWVAGFDIIYACQDQAFDKEAKLKSIPVRLGVAGALRLSAICHAFTILCLLALPWLCPQVGLGWVYFIGVLAVAGLLIYEHRLVRPDDLARVNVAFFQVNAIISLGLLIVVTLDLFT